MQTIKCILCGSEWTHTKAQYRHPANACELSDSYTYRPIVLAVNRAIEAALMQRITLGQIKVFPKALTAEEIKKERES